MVVDSSIQRITRLTPLSAILALIEARVGVVSPRQSSLQAARDFTFADDVVVPECPPQPIALRDGFPVESAMVADAGPYAPVPLPLTTRPIDVGEPLPSGTDAVLPFDAVTLSGYRAEAVAPIAAQSRMTSASAAPSACSRKKIKDQARLSPSWKRNSARPQGRNCDDDSPTSQAAIAINA